MDKFSRIIIIIYSFTVAVIALLVAAVFILPNVFFTWLSKLETAGNAGATIIIAVSLLICALSVGIMVTALLSGRLRKARVRTTGIGTIDIGIDAIESLALNAAKAAQAGVKTCKAGVMPAKAGKIAVNLAVMTYSDVELPPMMQKVQERVSKDIERYTGIEVDSVQIKVTKVDQIAAGVDR